MRSREFAALALSPLASGTLQCLMLSNWRAFFLNVVLAYIFAAFVGIPTLVVLRRFQWRTLPKYLLAGLADGVACGLLMGMFAGYSGYSFISVLGGMFIFSAHGFVVALAYWLLAYGGADADSAGPSNVRQ